MSLVTPRMDLGDVVGAGASFNDGEYKVKGTGIETELLLRLSQTVSVIQTVATYPSFEKQTLIHNPSNGITL